MEIQTPCGKAKSSNGKPFTENSRLTHMKNCPSPICKSIREAEEEREYDPFSLLDDDMPDGAYFAMHQEIYGY